MNSDRHENVFRSRHNRRSDRKGSDRGSKSRDRNRELKSTRRNDLRSRITNLKRGRSPSASRDRRSASPLHSRVHKVTDSKNNRSKSPTQNKSKPDDRKSYQKYLNERTNFLKSQLELEGVENACSSSFCKVESEKDARHDSKHEKRNKKSKKKHRKGSEKGREKTPKKSIKSSRTDKEKEKREEREQSISLSESDTEERTRKNDKRRCSERNSKERERSNHREKERSSRSNNQRERSNQREMDIERERSNQREMDIERERRKREEARNKAKERNDKHSNETVMSTRNERNSRDRWMNINSREREENIEHSEKEQRDEEKQEDSCGTEQKQEEKQEDRGGTEEQREQIQEEQQEDRNGTEEQREQVHVLKQVDRDGTKEHERKEIEVLQQSSTNGDRKIEDNISNIQTEGITNQESCEKVADNHETSDLIKMEPQTSTIFLDETEPISSPEKDDLNDNFEDDFEDFDEADLSSLSSSSLSLSSEEEIEHEWRIATPLDRWIFSGSVNKSLRKSGSPPPLPRDRVQSRSRSRSRLFEFQQKSKSRSVSPPIHSSPMSSSRTWESQVSDFVRAIGGESRKGPSNSAIFLDSMTCLVQPPPVAAPINIPPPPIMTPYLNQFTPLQIPPPHAFIGVPQLQDFYPEPMSMTIPPPVYAPIPYRRLSQEIIPNLPLPAPIAPSKPKVATPPPPHIEEEIPSAEEITLTPLMKFVGQKLADKKLTHLQSLKEGFFRYNLLSVATRGEWVAEKVLEAFDKSGYNESKMYNIAALKGRAGFKQYLETASKRVNFGTKLKLTNQDLKLVNCVVQLVVQYFTFDGSQDEEEDFNFEEEEQGTNDEQNASDGNMVVGGNVSPIKSQAGGVAQIVQNLKMEKAEHESSKNQPAVLEQPPINPWSTMWNWMQSENFKTFLDLKKNLAKGFLGSGGKFSKNPFEAAQEMVSCWVIAGFSLNSIQQMLMSAEDGKVLPQSNYTLDQGKLLFHELLDQLKAQRSNLPPHLTDDDLEFLVRKTLIYVARGCDRMSALSANPALSKMTSHHHKNKSGPPSNINYVYNYLPPGLRELENSVKPSSATKPADETDEDPSLYLSSDPLNRIIDPVAGSHRPGELPNRKYLIGSVHLDWVVINGRPEIFEISVYVSDMTSLDLYIVTEALQKHQDTLEHLNFVSNPDRHEFYFVQVGIGCVRAEWRQKGMEKLAAFLEEKRQSSTSENQNNGLVLLFRGEEELSVMLAAWQATGYNDLMLDTVKGFGCMDNYMEQNKSSKLDYTTPKLNVGGTEGFYTAEVKRGIEVSSFISKSKGQALHQAYEIFLQQSPNYQNFIQPYCFPSFSPQVTALKLRLKQIEEMYSIEVFVAAALKRDSNSSQNLFLEGVFAPARHRDLRDKCSIVASRFCAALVHSGFDKSTLSKCFKRDPGFCINSSLILDKMNVAQRMSVTDQTMRFRAGILRVHPDLAGRIADEGKLTSESQKEQALAGLGNMTQEEKIRMKSLNKRYREKFGFPFVICARQNKKEAILDGLEKRLENSFEIELETGLKEVEKICKLRLLDIVKDNLAHL